MRSVNEYIGFVETGHTADFYFCIILSGRDLALTMRVLMSMAVWLGCFEGFARRDIYVRIGHALGIAFFFFLYICSSSYHSTWWVVYGEAVIRSIVSADYCPLAQCKANNPVYICR
jgi:hypothetical protein